MQFETLFKHPRQLWPLAFGQLWDTFSYYGTQTLLALYFIHVFHLSRSDSYLLYGAYTAFAYTAPILGGIIADKWLGGKKALIVGNLFNIAGNLLLMSFYRPLFNFGLAASLVGAGLYKSTSAYLVGELYKEGDIKKEGGFTWLYLAINVGGALGPLIYGFAVRMLGWNFGFLCSAIGLSISTYWLLSNQKLWLKVKTVDSLKKHNKVLLCFMLTSLIFLLGVLFHFPTALNSFILLLFASSLLYLAIGIKKYAGVERSHLIAIVIICIFSVSYFAAGLQTGITITLFIQEKILQGVLKTELPASVFSAFYPLFVLLLAPFATYFWSKLKLKKIYPNVISKLALGVILAACGIVLFALTTRTQVILPGILLGYLLLSAGELVLTPAIYTAISDLSPINMKSTMMGCYLLFTGIGGYMSGLLANASHFLIQSGYFSIPKQPAFFGEFVLIAGFTFCTALMIILFEPKLKNMITR